MLKVSFFCKNKDKQRNRQIHTPGKNYMYMPRSIDTMASNLIELEPRLVGFENLSNAFLSRDKCYDNFILDRTTIS